VPPFPSIYWKANSLGTKRALSPELSRRKLAVSKWPTRTLFLDEIGIFRCRCSLKLLRVLQEQEFERLGSGRTHRINVRVIAATHRDLAEMVKRNEFRSDLYYRLNVFPVMLPPLRERRQDIGLLVSHFVEMFGRKMGKRITCIPNETLSALIAYPWPATSGNFKT